MTGDSQDATRLRRVAAELRATARQISYRPDRETLLAQAEAHDACARAVEAAAPERAAPAPGQPARV